MAKAPELARPRAGRSHHRRLLGGGEHGRLRTVRPDRCPPAGATDAHPEGHSHWLGRLLEAQAAGTPVIASRTGGRPDALLPNETGLLVDADDAAGLARELNALLGDEQRLRALTLAARRYAESQSWRAKAERALAIIEGCSAGLDSKTLLK